MDIQSSIRLAHKQSLTHYITLEIEKINKESFLKSNHRYIEIELGIKNFPVNGIVFDFSFVKIAIKEIIALFQEKIVLCAKSNWYRVNQIGNNLLVITINEQSIEFLAKDCIVLDYEEFTEETMCLIVSRCMLGNLCISAEMEKLVISKVCLSKIKANRKVKVAEFNMKI